MKQKKLENNKKIIHFSNIFICTQKQLLLSMWNVQVLLQNSVSQAKFGIHIPFDTHYHIQNHQNWVVCRNVLTVLWMEMWQKWSKTWFMNKFVGLEYIYCDWHLKTLWNLLKSQESSDDLMNSSLQYSSLG